MLLDMQAHPWLVDIIAVYSAVAEEDGEPPAAELLEALDAPPGSRASVDVCVGLGACHSTLA